MKIKKKNLDKLIENFLKESDETDDLLFGDEKTEIDVTDPLINRPIEDVQETDPDIVDFDATSTSEPVSKKRLDPLIPNLFKSQQLPYQEIEGGQAFTDTGFNMPFDDDATVPSIEKTEDYEDDFTLNTEDIVPQESENSEDEGLLQRIKNKFLEMQKKYF